MNEAIFGLLGVFVGSFIPWIKETLDERRLRSQHALYLRARIVCVLDEYVEKCVEVVQDDGTVMGQAAERDENGQEYYVPQVPLPEPPVYPDDVDWKSIDGKLMYNLLALPNNARATDRYISASSENAFPPDYDELFEARCEGYAILGLEALELSKELRKPNEIPERHHGRWNPDWNPEQYLIEKKKKIEESREARAASNAELFPQMSNTLQDAAGK